MTRKTLYEAALLMAAMFAVSSSAPAATKTWNAATNTNWSTSATDLNWAESPFFWVNGDDAVFGATGVGAVNVAGAGVTARSVTLNTAGYTISGGTITTSTNLGSTPTYLYNQNATINSNLSFGIGQTFSVVSGMTATIGGNINATAANTNFGIGGAGSYIFNGSIGSNIGGVFFNAPSVGGNSATATFTVANTFTGQLWLGLGVGGANNTLNFSAEDQLGNGTGGSFIALQTNATLRYTGSVLADHQNRDLFWNTGAATIDITQASGDLKFNITGGALGGGVAGNFTKTGPGALTLASVSTGTFVPNMSRPVALNAGTLALQANGANNVLITTSMTGASGTSIKVLADAVAGAGTVRNDSLTANWSANLADMYVASGGTFDIRGNLTRVDALTGGGSIINSLYRPDSGIIGHTLTVGADNGSGNFSGVISGTGTVNDAPGEVALTKIGSGAQTLSGANTYNGTTTVSAGTLLADTAVSGTNSATGTGNVNVNATATLGGTGQIRPGTGNKITVASGGTLAPGASIGTLTIDGGGTAVNVLTMSSGSEFDFELGAGGVSFAAPGTSDQLSITSAAANDVAFNSNNIDFLLTGTYGYYKLFDSDLATAVEGSDAWSGLTLGGGSGRQIISGLNVTNLGAGLTGTLFVGDGVGIGDAGDIYLFVPEPGSLAMMLVGSVMLWLVGRKRIA